MEKFDLPNDDYTFEENINKIKKTDRVHADVVNLILSALFKNSIWGKRHYVTKEQLGITEGQNPSVENQIPTIPEVPNKREEFIDGDNIGIILSKVKKFFMDLKAVAFTGEYKDLLGKPTIPTVPGAIKNPYSIKVNGKTYDGSTATDVGTMGIGFGGTGATDAAGARTNLGAADSVHLHDDRYYTETETNNLLNAKAASSHKHSTTDITSGVLPIARGGTGATDAAGVRTNLGAADSAHLHDDRYYTETETNNLLNTKAASSHKHSTTDITSGVLPIARGGTGATDAAGVRSKLGLGAAATYGVANNCTTNVAGFALDALQGKNLQEQLNSVNSNLALGLKNLIHVEYLTIFTGRTLNAGAEWKNEFLPLPKAINGYVCIGHIGFVLSGNWPDNIVFNIINIDRTLVQIMAKNVASQNATNLNLTLKTLWLKQFI